MIKKLGIRREDKNKWEKRVPLVPEDLEALLDAKKDLEIFVQPSSIRIFKDNTFKKAGATVKEDLSDCDLIMGVKEFPLDFLQPDKTYLYFSHTLKGQAHNMPMLKKIMDLDCTLLDYEKIVDEKGRRLVFFGHFAGLAGMLDSFWALGKRLEEEGYKTPFSEFAMAHEYANLAVAKKAVVKIGKKLNKSTFHKDLQPLVFGFTGYGNVSKGAQEIFDLLPFKEISPEALLAGKLNGNTERVLWKVVFHENHTVRPRAHSKPFDLKDYFGSPEKYESAFRPYVDHLSVLINCIYWSPKSPRLLTRKDAGELWKKGKKSKLKVIGDISCDINGGIEFTLKETDPDRPVFVYNPVTEKFKYGVKGTGPVVMAVDNLPCELSAEASEDFSKAMMTVMPDLLKLNHNKPFDRCELPAVLKRATIVWRGKLTPDFQYLKKFLP